jgi:hypothetical protein
MPFRSVYCANFWLPVDQFWIEQVIHNFKNTSLIVPGGFMPKRDCCKAFL